MNPNPYPQPFQEQPPAQPPTGPAQGQPFTPPAPMQQVPGPIPAVPAQKPNEISRGFAVAGLVLAVIAAVCALMPLWDKVSVFGVVGLALDAIAACSLFNDRNRTPVWIGMVVVAALLCIASILVVALT
ncbi:hypothetical protein [Bifidobacterium aerophilum]|uniref:Uncharacterized protein n=1 Tax=Bifidobacterium aerophilum TaxID=1798155 RepID=A0A6N9Z812_9BIFI|nr:hypothetical protein [Bifidobacterium aerophilum]NEG90245.1 hypothetical protein [Bifidobacterium aerophilum]